MQQRFFYPKTVDFLSAHHTINGRRLRIIINTFVVWTYGSVIANFLSDKVAHSLFHPAVIKLDYSALDTYSFIVQSEHQLLCTLQRVPKCSDAWFSVEF